MATYLVFGDLHGRVLPAFRLAARWRQDHGEPVGALLQVGDLGFFPDHSRLDRATAKFAARAVTAALLCAALAGSCAGFLSHNVHPAAMFMGDSGSMLIGLLLAASTIRVTGQVDPAMLADERALAAFLPIILPVAVMALPLLDLGLAVVRRMMAGKSPFSADAKHLHHRMLRLGHSHARAVLLLYLWTAIFAFGSV